MNDADRFRLHFGPYRMPRLRLGGWLACRLRGSVRVAAIADSPVQWPVTRRGWRLCPILCGSLERAVRKESELAVAHWWGVSLSTVQLWRKTLGVPAVTEGTRRLQRAWMPERLDDEARARQREALRSPERAAKIGAALRGKSRPPELMARLHEGNRGRTASPDTRQKMSAAHRARGTRPPAAGPAWPTSEISMLGTATDKAVAARIGRSWSAVASMRERLGILPFKARQLKTATRIWTPAEDRQLGTAPDVSLAARFGCTATMAFNRRRRRGMKAFRS